MATAENITYMDDFLYKAAARGDIDEFKNFKGIELESLQTPNGNNVLHVNLATKGCIKFTEHMLNECPSLLLQVNAQGRTPLHIAARHGDSDIVKYLIVFRAERADQGDLERQETTSEAVRRMLRMTDLKSDTALHVAARYGHAGVVQELVEFEDPDYSYSVNKNQETPVYIAARTGDGGLLVSKILDKLKSTAHGGPKGRTALHAAAMSGNAGDTRAILEKIGGKVTKETDEKGHTPLHYAAHLGHISVVEELLKWDKSAAYIADTKSQMTPLLMAARQGYVVMVRTILSFCPDCWEIFDQRGWNFLHFLAFRERVNFDFNDTVGRKFNLNDVKTEYGFGRDLFDAKDESGITPRQVDGARHPPRYFSAYFSSTNQGREEKEQIMKLLEAVLKEQVADVAVRPSPILDQEKEMEKVKGSHMVVATLIATMTFAAAIAVPGGYKSDEGPDQGAPFLLHDAAFIVFVVSDGLAFFSSMFAIILHFRTFASGIHVIDVMLASGAIVYSLTALMIAFYTGVFAILRPSMVLAIFSLCLGLIIHVVILLVNIPVLISFILREFPLPFKRCVVPRQCNWSLVGA